MIDLPSIYFGALLGAFAFTLLEICNQTRRIVQRAGAWGWQNSYLYMIWSEAIVNLVFAIITILHFNGNLQGTLAFYFGTVTLWALQTQILSQIIANRVSLIMMSRQRATWMRWGLFVLILGVNAGVYVIWIPAYLPDASPQRKRLNDIFEKFRLIAGGLPKYWALFKMNTVLIVVSTAMDAALLGMLSLSDPYVYVQFAPLAYTIKLYIELVMTSLIAKVVSSEAAPSQAAGGSSRGFPSWHPPLPMGHDRYGDKYGSTKSIFGDKSVFGDTSIFGDASTAPATPRFDTQSIRSGSPWYDMDIEGRHEAPGDESYLDPVPETSIIKTVTTTVVSENKDNLMPPSRSRAGSIKSHRSLKSHKSHRSHKSHKSRLRSGLSEDVNSDPVPPPPPLPDKEESVPTTPKSRSAPHPLTSRFNQRRR
ncbi:hypothetical protein IF1G_09807 [Cordyceps javanica]|uniref:Uncharacterized protein n=1 Tax=Cordyceps javanica TaxID=43265 RepID=A0A545UQJ9_9HYPO|nr:hypothetical protein IF1G_09807 [Cordyceps javanica]